MATDPNMTEEQKRRQREALAGSFYSTYPRPAGLGRTSSASEVPVSRTPADVDAEQRAENQQILQRGQQAQRGADRTAARRAAGLTRIYRATDAQGNPVYSDQDLGPGAETRYYGAMGGRADAAFDPRTGRDVAFDVNTEEGQNRLLEAGTRQRGALGRIMADQQLVREGRDPSNPQGLEWSDTPRGRRVTTAQERADAQGGGRGLRRGQEGLSPSDQLAMLRLQEQINQNTQANTARQEGLDLQRRGLDRQELNDMRRAARENPQAFLREELGRIRGMEPAELDAFFRNTDQGRFLASTISDTLGEVYGQRGSNIIPGSGFFTDTPGNLGDLEEAPWWNISINPRDWGNQRYVTPQDRAQRGVTLGDLGLNANDEWLLEYFGRMNRQNERE